MPKHCNRDPRDVLVQDKFYTHLPDPLFDVIAGKRLPSAAILVLLTHLKAGMISGDHCSEIPLAAVASRCKLSTSTVTRSYQLLIRLGLLRRADPGRDSARPHQQAVAVTEFRLPADLVRGLDRYPNRRRPPASSAPLVPEDSRPPEPPSSDPAHAPAPRVALPDPFVGLSGRERIRAQAALLGRMSKTERARYDQAFSQHAATMAFDTDSALTAEEQRTVLQLLAILARPQPQATPARALCLSTAADSPRPRRRLSILELARLRRGLQTARGSTDVDELCRQIVWSAEEGALAKFSALHAIHIALKKVREGAWSRPHRMPPNWAVNLSVRGGSAPSTGRGTRTPVDRGGDQGLPAGSLSSIRQLAPEPRGAAGVTPAARVLSGWMAAARPN